MGPQRQNRLAEVTPRYIVVLPTPQKGSPTKRALDGWDSAPFSGFFYTRTESCFRSFIYARPPASNANR